MERDDNMETTRFSRGLRIITLALRITTIIVLVTSLIILVTNVLRVPYGENQVKTVHFYDITGFRYMVYIIVIVIGYSTLQIIFVLLQLNDVMNHEPNFIWVYYGEWASSILLVLGSIAGYSSTREYQKWLADTASDQYDNYFRKSYAAASMFLLAFLSTFISSIMYSCALANTLSSGLTDKKNSSKVNAVADEL